MSKRLIWSDVHLNAYQYGATLTKDGFNSRLWTQWKAAQEMINDAENEGVQYAYFTGDAFHTHGIISSQALTICAAIFGQLRKRGIKVRALPGNHDFASKSIHSLAWLPEEELYGQWDDGGLLVRGLPYTASEEVLKRFLSDVGEDGEGLLLLHQGVSGIALPTGVMLDERLTPEMIPDNCICYSGHYHEFHEVSDRLIIPGSLTGLNWSDLNQPKGWVITEDSGVFSHHKVQTAAPDFISTNKDSDIQVIKGNFVRYTDTVTLKEQAVIRADLKEIGALTVEFPRVKVSKKQEEIRSGETITAEHIAKQFDKRETGRRAEVGQEIREGHYEAPSS